MLVLNANAAWSQVRPIPGVVPRAPATLQTDTRPAGPAPAVRVTALGPTTVRIAWRAVATAKGYVITRTGGGSFASIPVTPETPDAGPAGKPVAGTAGPLAPYSFIDTGRIPNESYTYQVVALQPAAAALSSGASAPATITMPPGLSPGGLVVTAVQAGAVTLKWQPAADASGYVVFRDGAQITSQPVRGTTFTDVNVTSGIRAYAVASLYRVDGKGETFGTAVGNSPVLRVVVSRCGTSQ